MAWEWVAPTVTGAVAVATLTYNHFSTKNSLAHAAEVSASGNATALGIASLDARRGLSSAIREERRVAYASLLGALDRLERDGARRLRDLRNADDATKAVAVRAFTDLHYDVIERAQELVLLGPKKVAEPAMKLSAEAGDFIAQVKSDGDTSFYFDVDLRTALLVAMKETLGYVGPEEAA
jgi:hypothetical protein